MAPTLRPAPRGTDRVDVPLACALHTSAGGDDKQGDRLGVVRIINQ